MSHCLVNSHDRSLLCLRRLVVPGSLSLGFIFHIVRFFSFFFFFHRIAPKVLAVQVLHDRLRDGRAELLGVDLGSSWLAAHQRRVEVAVVAPHL